MLKKVLWSVCAFSFCYAGSLFSHCQMPCGIYHDDMVYDQIDQFVETMAKGISILTESKNASVHDHNECVRWIVQKENDCNDVALLLTRYFLQQKIKPGEDNTAKRVESAHKLLFLLVPIKQTADLKFLNDFYEEWERFKLMFHIEGYECKMEQIKLKKWAEKRKKEDELQKNGEQSKETADSESDHDHDHDDHDHDHDHDHVH